jgi:hypothetical protein
MDALSVDEMIRWVKWQVEQRAADPAQKPAES